MGEVTFDRKKFNEINDAIIAHFDAAPILSPRTKEELITIYGCPKMNVKNPDDIRPPSPSESITNTQEYLKKLARDGFVHSVDTDAFDREMMKRKNEVLQKNKKSKQQEEYENSDITSLVTQEQYLQYWINTDTVQSIVAEINKLPLREVHTNFILVSRFYNSITAFVRKAKARQTKKKLSDAMLKKQMYDFVMEARNLRKSIFDNAIRTNTIKTEDLSPDLRKEFAEAISTVEVKKEEDKPKISQQQLKKIGQENEYVFLAHARATMDKFPKPYQMNEETFYPHELKSTEQKLLQNIEKLPSLASDIMRKQSRSVSQIKTPVIIQPKTKKINVISNFMPRNKETKSNSNSDDGIAKVDAVKYFLQHEDPIENRSGDITSIVGELHDMADVYLEIRDVQPEKNPFPHLQVQDYVPPKIEPKPKPTDSAVLVGDTLITDTIWNTAQMGEELSQTKVQPQNPVKEEPKEEEEVIINGITMKNLKGAQQALSMSPTFKFLMTHSIFGENKIEGIEDSIPVVKKLDEYLKRLGYSSFHKLELFKKYSTNTGDMSKIADTINFWENMALAAEKFDNAYRELKSYISIGLSIDETIGKGTKLDPLKASFKAACENLESAGQNLQTAAGDIAWVRNHSYHEFIERKKQKIDEMEKKSRQESEKK